MKYLPNCVSFLMAGLMIGLLPIETLAKDKTYPVASRAIFLAGCLTDDSNVNFQNGEEVYSKMRVCVCLLDKFQVNYTNTEFMTLFEKANRNDRTATRELEAFARKYYSHCL